MRRALARRRAASSSSCPAARRSAASSGCSTISARQHRARAALRRAGAPSRMRAIARPAAGQRKIVLATSIAETSLTIEGIRIVIDCGLSRAPRFDPARADAARHLRVSRAVEQRAGRAGRLEPGVGYRLWAEAASGRAAALRPARNPRSRSRAAARPRPLGRQRSSTLAWLDPPPAPPGPRRALCNVGSARSMKTAASRKGRGDAKRCRCSRASPR